MKRKVIGIFTILCFAAIGISCGKGEMKGNQQKDWAVMAGRASSEKRGAKLNLEDGEFTDLRVEKMEKLSVYIEEMIYAERMMKIYSRSVVRLLEGIKDALEDGRPYSISAYYVLEDTDGGTELINTVTYMQEQGFCIESYQFIKTDTYTFLPDELCAGGCAVPFPVLVKYTDKDGNVGQQLWIVTLEKVYNSGNSGDWWSTYRMVVDFELY